MRPSVHAAFTLALALAAPLAHAVDRQISLSIHAGIDGSTGPLGGLGPSVDANVGYGINDAFTLYGVVGYGLAFPGSVSGLRHDGTLALGLRYAFDYISVVPYLGVALRADVLAAGGTLWATPGAEARGGVYYLLNRTTIIDLQGSFAEPFLSTGNSMNFFTVTLGLGWFKDL